MCLHCVLFLPDSRRRSLCPPHHRQQKINRHHSTPPCDYDHSVMDNAEKYRRRVGFWRCSAFVFGVCCLGLLVALVVTVVVKNQELEEKEESVLPCPAQDGGLLTSGDPETPGPFHDLTLAEYKRLYEFLRQQENLNLASPDTAAVNTSNIFIVDLLLPAKQSVLSFLDNQGKQPAREARVMIFRGDKPSPVVEEYRVGPLDNPTYAVLTQNPQRRNPIQFTVRPVGGVEFYTVFSVIMSLVDQEVGTILQESYGGTFTDCGDTCLTFYPTPVGTALHGDIDKRKIWFWGNYPAEYYSLYPLDFGVRVDLSSTNPSQWTVEQVWYSGRLFDSLQDLRSAYQSEPNMNKTRVQYVHNSKTLKTTQSLRGDPAPETPKRPPVLVEPDGKRYSIQHRHVSYLHWDFDIRLSALTGPQVYDIRFHGDRIAYELGLAEIAVFYSGDSPVQRVTDFVDSGALIGTHSKSLIPGSDCPEGATFLNVSFLAEAMGEPTTLERATCVFEQNTGIPLRRHLSYSRGEGAFYGGMPDSVLVVRSILTIVNYDYIMDFVFHQSGAIEMRAISTGYILSTFYRSEEAPYGFRLDDHISGNLHHHMFHFKADLDIGGTSNRYETLDISKEEVNLRQISPTATYRQTRFDRHLRKTENDAVYHYNFDTPKYHIVYREGINTQYGVPRAFRVHVAGMSKQLLTPDVDNERSIPWARQQLAVTVHKDNELVSSSPYAMFDSLDPVTNFTNFISDESIVDQDLVFWITMGTHHIPHTEDLPVTPTVGGHLSFFLLPYNYFPECPSVSSRDNIRVEYVTPNKPADGLKVERNGNKENGACGVLTLEQLVKQRPDDIIQTNNDFKLL